MTINVANQPGDEVRLGRSTLASIGRHLGSMYEDVVSGQMPAGLADALERLRARDEDSRNGSPADRHD